MTPTEILWWILSGVLFLAAGGTMVLNWIWRENASSTVLFVAPFFAFWGGLAAPIPGLAWIALAVMVLDPASWSPVKRLK